MKFSIITPTHLKNAFLGELYDSLTQQTYSNWEWVIFINGKDPGDIPNLILKEIPFSISDNRVKVYFTDEKSGNVGFIKKIAFESAEGDVLVEVDHDDLLTPDCLEELFNVFNENPDVGFVYSDNAKYAVNGDFIPYDPSYGWTHHKRKWKDEELYVMESFEPDSKSMSFIWFAPDHVRAWTVDCYRSIGGHNPDLNICDDHELLIRTYLNTKMFQIKKPLYIYRITGDNTWLERNQEIQKTTVQLFEKYAWQLACREAELNGLDIVELGGGINPKPGCNINIDLDEGNVTCDLNDGIPLSDNSVGVIWASHILEHLHDKQKIISEIHRVLVDGGWAFIQVPSTDGRGAFQDPTHVSYWNENSFLYYTSSEKAKYIRNDNIKFQSFRLKTFWWPDNVAVTDAWLVAVKSDKRRPNLLSI